MRDRSFRCAGPVSCWHGRLVRAVELDVREIKTILAGEIKTKLDQTATKRDIDRLKLWAAVGCLVGTIAVIGWLVRLLSTVPAPPP